MPDRDPLRDALADLRDSALPHLAPAGPDRVRRALRRRRTVRAASTAALAATVAVLAVLGPRAVHRPQPVDTPTPTVLVPTDTASPPSSPTATVTSARAQASCRARVYPAMTYAGTFEDGTVITFHLATDAGATYCPGEKVEVGWVSYVYQTNGRQRIYAHDEVYLSPGQFATSTLRLAKACGGNYYFLAGDQPLLPTIPAGGTSQPYPALYPQQVRGVWEGYYTSVGRPSCARPPTTTPPASSSPGPSPT